MISVLRNFFFLCLLIGASALNAQTMGELNQSARGFRLSTYAGIPLADRFDSHIGNYDIEVAYFPHFGMELGKNTPVFHSCYVYTGIDLGVTMFSFRFQYDMTKYPALNTQPSSSNDFMTEFIPHAGPRVAFGHLIKRRSGIYYGEIGYTLNFYSAMQTDFSSSVASTDSIMPNGDAQPVEILSLRMKTQPRRDHIIHSMDFSLGRVFFLGPRTRMQVGAIAHFCFTPVAQGSYLAMNGTPDEKVGSFTVTGHFIGLHASLLIGSKSSVVPVEE
ncbi:MAG: hypothetical protein ACRCYO_10890 [Bacteroidia bacterium]